MHGCNPNSQKGEVGSSGVQGQPRVHSETLSHEIIRRGWGPVFHGSLMRCRLILQRQHNPSRPLWESGHFFKYY